MSGGTDMRQPATAPSQICSPAAPSGVDEMADLTPAVRSALLPPRTLPIRELRWPISPRAAGQNLGHIQALAASGAPFPPIVVHRATMRVIDGMHRLRAASLRGESEINARLFTGSAEDAFVLAVEANVKHGLPLTLAERTASAARILRTHPQWSDRAIASVTGLAGKTVGELRRRVPGQGASPDRRIGRDGRVRPLDSTQGRRAAARIFASEPDVPLREVARRTGISPGTARDVRDRMRRGEDVVPANRRKANAGRAGQQRVAVPGDALRRAIAEGGGTAVPLAPTARAPRQTGGTDAVPARRELEVIFWSLCRDPSLRLTEPGRKLLRTLQVHLAGDGHWEHMTDLVPVRHAPAVAAAARECARTWLDLADRLDARDCA